MFTFPQVPEQNLCDFTHVLTSLFVWFPITSHYKRTGKKNGVWRDRKSKGFRVGMFFTQVTVTPGTAPL